MADERKAGASPKVPGSGAADSVREWLTRRGKIDPGELADALTEARGMDVGDGSDAVDEQDD